MDTISALNGLCCHTLVPQGIQYDADAQLATMWVPELAGLPAQYKHQPWMLTPDQANELRVPLVLREQSAAQGQQGQGQQEQAAVSSGYYGGIGSYPAPMVDPATQTGQLPVGEKRDKQKKKDVKRRLTAGGVQS